VKIHNIAEDGSWRYSGKHKDIPVQPGDIWRVGEHIFVCGDIEGDQASSPLSTLLKSHPPTLIYADPPWGSGLARSYRTKAGSDNGSGRAVDFPNLIRSLLLPAKTYKTVAYVENGVREERVLKETLIEMGATITGHWNTTYYKTKPAILYAADFRPVPQTDHPDFTGVDDEYTPLMALRHHPVGTVLDPCAGRGLTARTAQTLGWKSINHELSPYRMAEALDSIFRMTDQPIERVLYERDPIK